MADDFQPRFVDLVRNYSTTQGTSNFVLGSAVTGYQSFGSAVESGDSFYYSAVGIEKPAEFEVGRGTMQADGTISRDPTNGTLTSFTGGNKTVALIAAAEWYEMIQARSLADTTKTAATRTNLSALADKSSPVLLSEVGREGTFVFDGSDLSTAVAADSAQGIYVAPASDPSGASGAWTRRSSGPVEARWFGAVGDGVADDSAAIQAALTYFETAGGGELRLGSGTFKVSGTLLLLATDVTIDANEATISSSDEWAIPMLYVGGDRSRIHGGTWKLTGGHQSVRAFDVEGRDCEIDGARLVKEPEASGYQTYVRFGADGFVMRNCRTEGSNGIYCEASHSAFLFNRLRGPQVGGDDALAIKAIQGITEKIRIIGNNFENLAYFCSIGSEIGIKGADDPSYSKMVRAVQILGNNGKACSGILFIKPGAVSVYDYRHGTVEAVTVSNNTLYDLSGAKFECGFAITAARGARVRNIKGSGNVICARAQGTESSGHKKGLDVYALGYDSNDPEISDIDIGFTFEDPYDGAANGADTPGHPIRNIVNVEDASQGGGSIIGVTIRADGSGSSGPGIQVQSGLNDAVTIDRAVLKNVNMSAGESGGGIKTSSRLRIPGDVSISVGSGNPYNLGTTGEVVSEVSNVFYTAHIAAGTDEVRRPWAAPRRCYVTKVELLSDIAIPQSTDDVNYTQFEFRNIGGTGNIFQNTRSKLTGGQAFPANTYNTVHLAREITNSTQQSDCFFQRDAQLYINKNDFGSGNAVRNAYLRVHWAPY